MSGLICYASLICSILPLYHAVHFDRAGSGVGGAADDHESDAAQPPWAPILKGSGKVMGEGSFGKATLYDLKSPCVGAVVVKEIMKKPIKTKEWKALVREISCLRAVSGHANVLQMYDYYPKDVPEWFDPVHLQITTEVARGGELDAALAKQEGPFDLLAWWNEIRHPSMMTRHKKRVRILLMMTRDTLAGLAYLHSKRYIHHDIKPQNIWWADTGDECIEAMTCRYVLGDFGYATEPDMTEIDGKEVKWDEKTEQDPDKSWSNDASGTDRYMAAEQNSGRTWNKDDSGRRVYFKSDVYSVGYSLAELLLRHPKDSTALTRAKMLAALEPKKAHYPKDFIDLLITMISFNHEGRPTAEEAHKLVKNIIKLQFPTEPHADAPHSVPDVPSCVAACKTAQEAGKDCVAGA